MGWLRNLRFKLNPAQGEILNDEGTSQTSTINTYTVQTAYKNIEVVQRGSNLIVDSSASITFDVKDKIHGLSVSPNSITPKRIGMLLNHKPNPYINADAFLRNVYLDLVLEGNAFIYYDGAWLYNLPAKNVEIIGDPKTFIDHYLYGETKFFPNELIHIKENSADTIYRGDSRLLSALDSIKSLSSMLSFQQNFFSNNAIPGMILKTANILSEKVKERTILRWMQQYNPTRGGKRPMILDGDFQVENLGHTDFRELDFANSVDIHEGKILKALGVPSILLDSGNNANIAPNIKMFYINTVLPLVDKVCAGFEFFFGYDLKPNKTEILALRPELKEEAGFFTSLTNGGIITVNEAREGLRYEASDQEDADELVRPANVAGSAVDPTQGGKPPGKKKPTEDDKKE